jgi:AcrR family transcriptional regulator
VARTTNVAEHAARRDAILDAAQRGIVSKGYERLTIQDILDDLQISKGAFYHYFDSKPEVIEALAGRLVSDSERMLAQIIADRDMSALEKLRRFFSEAVRWKSARQNLFVAMLSLWYAPENVAFGHKVDNLVARRLAPLLTVLVQQGIDEQEFTTAYPEHAGTIIVALVQALQGAMAQRLLVVASESPEAPTAKEMITAHAAHIEAIERYLGIAAGALHRVDARTVHSWIAAVKRADADLAKARR